MKADWPLWRLLAAKLLLACLAACSLSPRLSGTEAPAPTGTLAPSAPATIPGEAATPTSPAPEEVTLRVWLPPQFDPDSGSPAGELLRARLEAFTGEHGGVRLEVRIKALEGAGGMLSALSAASAAAPEAIPDLLALPRPLLESAILKGLTYPFDGLTNAMAASDWYAYARQLAQLETSTFGIPFAGDALALVYRPEALESPPASWEATLAVSGTLALPAADPEALFTLAEYQAAEGALLDELGRPGLEAITLTQVLSFYQSARLAGLMPDWAGQLTSEAQAWEALQAGQADMAITWASRYLQAEQEGLRAAPLPTLTGVPFTLATGWAWALGNPLPERQLLSAQLVEYLVEAEFLAQWTAAAGYLPPRAGALTGWQEEARRLLAHSTALAAQLAPSSDVLLSLGPALQQAVQQVLRLESTPETAAQEAVEAVK